MRKMGISAVLSISLSAIVLASNNHYEIVKDEVDIQELNRYYDKSGKLILEQMVYWDYCIEKRLEKDRDGFTDLYECLDKKVVDWRLLKNKNQIPIKDYKTGKFTARFRDEEDYREISSKIFYRSETFEDVEVGNRFKYPVSCRRKLVDYNDCYINKQIKEIKLNRR